MLLTSEQVAHFNVFGFLVLRGVLSKEEVDTIRRESDEIFDEARGGREYAGEKEPIQPFFERRPFMSTLPVDDRIYGIGESILGPEFFLDVTEGWRHTGTTKWHGGGAFTENIPSCKIAFYVEPLTRDTGCLRVVPGSHIRSNPDLLESLRGDGFGKEGVEPFGISGSEIPCVALETEPGDIVVFPEDTLHASYGGRKGRYQHALTYIRNPVTDKEILHIKNGHDNTKFSYRPCKSYIESENPRMRRLVTPLVELGFEAHDI